jgi:hypothetical protein
MVIPMRQQNSGILRGALPMISQTLLREHRENRLGTESS